MKKYLVSIEFRYSDAPKGGYNFTRHNKTITIGVYDNFNQACVEGNKLLEVLESKFKPCVHGDGRIAPKQRFNTSTSYLGFPLVSNGGYLKTPFEFYAKIETLNHTPIENVIDELVSASVRYREYKLRDNDED